MFTTREVQSLLVLLDKISIYVKEITVSVHPELPVNTKILTLIFSSVDRGICSLIVSRIASARVFFTTIFCSRTVEDHLLIRPVCNDNQFRLKNEYRTNKSIR